MSDSKRFEITPLEWFAASSRYPNWYSATTIFCTVSVEQDEDSGQWTFRYCVEEYYDQDSEHVESLEAGKARAQEWYLSRLLPALSEVQP